MSEPWLFWPLLALLGALLAMDENSLAQTWLSQPLPACTLAGLLAGDPVSGMLLGFMLQLVVVGNLPVGASFELDSVSAALGMTVGAVQSGWRLDALSSVLGPADGAGLAAARLGWLIVMVAAASLVGGRLVKLERGLRLGWMLDGYRSVRDGDLRRLEGLHRRSLMVTGLRGAVLTLAWALTVRLLWDLGPEYLPASVSRALGLVPLLVPALAVGTLVDRFGLRQAWPLVAGLAVGVLVLIKVMG